ncbi:hypothetical protein C5167_050926 [Papaver somniferum]|uniref:Uncharacterized protein n=1 Tax=Papaver somniferum TaxID=3469 RepID=A0A4Y7KTJ3_PAPSO|nr:hypothetical protein C5167_050926 [Papaver somniferum]
MRGSKSTPTATASVSSNKRPPRTPAKTSSVGDPSTAGDASVVGDASVAGEASSAGTEVEEPQSKKRKTPGDATEDGTEVTEQPQGKKRTSVVWNHFDPEDKPSIMIYVAIVRRELQLIVPRMG